MVYDEGLNVTVAITPSQRLDFDLSFRQRGMFFVVCRSSVFDVRANEFARLLLCQLSFFEQGLCNSVDCAELVKRYADRILLCHMNSGATQPMAFPRGSRTFLPIADYPIAERLKNERKKGAVAEITVDYAVPDIRDFVVEVFETGGGIARENLV